MADTSVCTVPPCCLPDLTRLSAIVILYQTLDFQSVFTQPPNFFPALPALLPLSYYTPVLFTLVLFISVLSASVVYPCLIWN